MDHRSNGMSALVRIWFAGLAALSAFLVIAVQPAATMAVLPLTGGSPAFWQTSQALFQAMLLLGYLGSALLLRRQTSRRLVWYGSAMAAGSLALFMAFGTPPVPDSVTTLTPVRATMVIGRYFGLAFVLLSTTSLACQYMFIRLTPAGSPFWIYVASNTGGLTAAVAYPFIIQPYTDVSSQLAVWGSIATASALLLSASAFGVAMKRPSEAAVPAPRDRLSLWSAARWFAGGAGPVGLSLACTSYLSTDLGSHPLVWLGPFTAYLATMIVAFSHWGGRCVAVANRIAPFAVALLLAGLVQSWPNTLAAYALHLGGVTILLLSWHGWFASIRPRHGNLEWFYGCATSGGLAIGAFLGVVVPVALNPALFGNPNFRWHRLVFGSLAPEYVGFIIASGILLAVAVREMRHGESVTRGSLEGLLLGAAVLLTSGAAVSALSRASYASPAAWIGVATLIAVAFVLRSRCQLVACVLAILVGTVAKTSAGAGIVEHQRSSFGQLKVQDTATSRTLTHGSTTHGVQSLACITGDSAAECSKATGYYHQAGPVGAVIRAVSKTVGAVDVGVIGLGVGTLAAYCSGSDTMTFMEIDPAIVSIAENYFRFLSHGRRRCRSISIDMGDARLSLRRGQSQRFDLLVADAFSSDAVPVHLLTAEAMREFMLTVKPHGLLVYHTSNRYFGLEDVLLAAAKSAGFKGLAVVDRGRSSVPTRQRLATQWVVIAADERALDHLEDAMAGDGFVVKDFKAGVGAPWTDDRHSLLAALRR